MPIHMSNGKGYKFRSAADRVRDRGARKERAHDAYRRHRMRQEPVWMRLPIPVGGAVTVLVVIYWVIYQMLKSDPMAPMQELRNLSFYAMIATVLGPGLLLWGIRRWEQAKLYERLANEEDEGVDLGAYRVEPEEEDEHVLDFAREEAPATQTHRH